jgi:hypothetical protein
VVIKQHIKVEIIIMARNPLSLRKIAGAALIGCVALAVASSAHARNTFLNDFNSLYGTSVTRLDSCGLCHNDFGGGGPGNSYYDDFLAGLDMGLNTIEALMAIEGDDSDGDGTSNLDEINLLFMPDWNCDNLGQADGAPADLNTYVDPLNPGCGAAQVPDIAVNPQALDYGTVNVGITSTLSTAISNVGTADLTVTGLTFGVGSSADFALNPGAPMTPFTVAPSASVDVPVDYTPGEEGADSGSLEIASDDPDTSVVTVSLSGNGIIPPPDQCVIGVSPPTLDYGTVEIGMTAQFATTVSNTGTVDCTVDASVSSATGEFVLASVASFIVAPNSSADVLVDYMPLDVGDDAGTLDLASNDPDQPLVMVPLAGSGVEAPPLVVDLDIAQFKVTKRVRLANVKPIGIQLTVRNAGLTNGTETRVATVTGVQGAVEVYRETLPVSDPAGNGRTRFNFPSFTPTAGGDINWTATIADDDPDDDVATATTTVVN